MPDEAAAQAAREQAERDIVARAAAAKAAREKAAALEASARRSREMADAKAKADKARADAVAAAKAKEAKEAKARETALAAKKTEDAKARIAKDAKSAKDDKSAKDGKTGRSAARDAKGDDKPAEKAKGTTAERYWVQVASGANRADLGKVWTQTKAKAPKLLGGKSPWTSPWRQSNRLLVGPFKTEEEAQGLVNSLGKAGMGGIQFTSRGSTKVEKLGGE